MNPTTRIPPPDRPKELREVSVVRITDPTAVGDVNEVYDMDVIDVPADFNPVSIIAGGK